MAKKIYVGNLAFQATEDQVRELFAAYGTVESIAMITDRDTGQFRGFCFVEMPASAADKAIAALDGKEVDGRNLRVNEARPKEERGGGYGGGRGGSGGGQRKGSNRNSKRNDYSSGGGNRW
ncbi:MAG: RNA-binding protein [Ardenticatenaceae bacterium]|nr:RNA-binding protein [Ardenticatenaceae bacterium]